MTRKAVASDLKKIEEAIEKIIVEDPELSRLFGLVTSVTGIGAATATQIIITTNELKDINDPKNMPAMQE